MNTSDVMTRPAQTCLPQTTLVDASRTMERSGCGALAVLDAAGHLSGIVTDRDLAIALGRTDHPSSRRRVAEAMTRNVRTCSPDEELDVALERMSEAKVRRLPVVDADGTLQGMLSIDDIVLWGLNRGGVTKKRLAKALRSIYAAHNPLFETEEIESSPSNRDLSD